jgi:hypothetical protein
MDSNELLAKTIQQPIKVLRSIISDAVQDVWRLDKPSSAGGPSTLLRRGSVNPPPQGVRQPSSAGGP